MSNDIATRIIELADELDQELDGGAKWTKAQHTCASVSGALRGIAGDLHAALAAPAPQPLPEHADHADLIATRLRRLARAIGCPATVPEDDETAVGGIFTVLGRLAGHAERVAKLHGVSAGDESAPMVDMVPPATARDRWMYEQGRLAERDPRTQPGRLSPFDAVAKAMRLASHLAGHVGMNDAEGAESISAALRSHLVQYIYPAAPQPGGEVLYQRRGRPNWDAKFVAEWEFCSAEAAADHERTPVVNDWAYEVRRLRVEIPAPSVAREKPADVLLRVIQRLNGNPYSLTKRECISEVEAMYQQALAAPEGQE